MICRSSMQDANIFASCSLDRSIKVWGVSGGAGRASLSVEALLSRVSQAGGTSSCHFTLTGHQRGVNCVECPRILHERQRQLSLNLSVALVHPVHSCFQVLAWRREALHHLRVPALLCKPDS